MARILSLMLALSCCVIVVTLAPSDNKVTSEIDVEDYLVRFGYMKKSGEGMGTNLEPAIVKFQRMAGIPITGKMDEKSLQMMNSVRCGIADFEPEDRSVRREERWMKPSVTWMMTNITSDMDRATQVAAIQKSFDLWQAITPLTLTQVDGDGDIEISFSSGEHGDFFPFDGPFKVLAHTFPPSPSPIGGDMHFDEAESWTADYSTDHSDGVSLNYVSNHELGHALGLRHSGIGESVMWPYYSTVWSHLHDTDRQEITALYQ